jgi:hypothetical protein
MLTTIRRLTGAVALPAAAAAIIGGAALGLAGTANAADTDDAGQTTVQNDGPVVSAPANRKPYWNNKHGYYDNNKHGWY